ncbi:MAG TPA: hypothetical protein VGP68_22210 [Gemmataceae bacterium]|nr:hypothetical protein [Gemmataceae bacterium]
MLMEVAWEYVQRIRVLLPGVYATCPALGKTVYMDEERLESGQWVASLLLATTHAQVGNIHQPLTARLYLTNETPSVAKAATWRKPASEAVR